MYSRTTQLVKHMHNDRISQLREEIERLQSQWPAHSLPAAMLLRLDELEEELEQELQREADGIDP